jgi:hypothetical protein
LSSAQAGGGNPLEERHSPEGLSSAEAGGGNPLEERHSPEGGNPSSSGLTWTPAYAEVTTTDENKK